MRLSHIALTFVLLLVTGTHSVASNDPITVNVATKKHATKSAAIEVTACFPATASGCVYDPTATMTLIKGRQFGVRVQSETASPTLDDAIASIKRMPNVSLRGSNQSTNVVVVWDRRL